MEEDRVYLPRQAPVGPNRGVKPLWPSDDYVAEEEDPTPAPPVAPPLPPLSLPPPLPPAPVAAAPPPAPVPDLLPQPDWADDPQPDWADDTDKLPPGVWPLAGATPVHAGPPIATTPPAGFPVSGPLPTSSPPAPAPHDGQPPHQGPPHQSPHQDPAHESPPPHQGPPANQGPPLAPFAAPDPFVGPPAVEANGNQGLIPPADPWASTAPLPNAPQSPWAAPPQSHVQAAQAPQQPPPAASHPDQRPHEVHPGVTELPQRPYPEAPGVYRMPPQAYSEQASNPEAFVPTAEEFARRRAAKPADPVARTGVRAAVNKSTLGLVKLAPGRHEQEFRQDVERIRRNFGGLRQVTVVNPKGGAGKTVAVLLLAMTFGQKRGGYVLAWDNNETQGTLGMRAQQDFHTRTVRDMLRDLGNFQGPHGRVGDLSQYVRAQGEGMFDVLASDESATAGEMLTATAFAEIREVVSRFYKLIFVDTGNNVRAQNWHAAIDATDQLVVTMSARNDSAETAARMLDHLEQTGRTRLVRQAVTVVSMPPRAKDIDLPPIQRHFAARTRAVLLAPYERLIDTGEPLRYAHLSTATQDAWLKVAAAVSEGL